jgi:hypothetical protein
VKALSLSISELGGLHAASIHEKDKAMTIHGYRTAVLVATTLAITSGCVAPPSSSAFMRRMKIVTAGHTGCLPDANDISNVTRDFGGTGTWNATCNGKLYLCSAVVLGDSVSSSCAPSVK